MSRVGGRDERLVSPELQANRIKDYAAAHGLSVEILEPELDVSGGKIERPILGEAIAGIERGEFEGIVVAQLDRLSRMHLADAIRTIERIESAGGGVVSVAENFDTATPEGRMIRNVFLSMNEMQLGRYSAAFAAVKIRAVEAGIWPFPIVPVGYRKGKDRRLVVDPGRAAIVEKAFRLRSGGAPWSIVAELLGKGDSGAIKVIRNRVYLGEIAIERLGVRNATAHEPLIDRALWEAAQLSHPRPPRGSSGPALLAGGLVRCAACSRTMTPNLERGHRQYRCFPRGAAGRCPAPALIAGSLIEPVVERTFLAHVDTVARSTPRTDTLDAAIRVLTEAEAELDAYQQAVSAADLGATAVASGLRSRAAAVEQARAELGRAQSASAAAGRVRRLSDEWERLGIEQRRHVLRGALGAVWVRKGRGPGRVKVSATGFEPPDLSRPGVSTPIRAVDWSNIPGEIPVVDAK